MLLGQVFQNFHPDVWHISFYSQNICYRRTQMWDLWPTLDNKAAVLPNGQPKSILDGSPSNTLDLPQPSSNESPDLTVAMPAALLLQVTMLTKDLSLTKHPRLKHLFLMPACQPLHLESFGLERRNFQNCSKLYKPIYIKQFPSNFSQML